MKYLVSLLAFASLALADIDYLTYDSHFTFSPTSAWTLVAGNDASGCGAHWDFSQPGTFTFTFPQASTTFKWWGWQFSAPQGGQATLCLDGATSGTSCHTVNYLNATAVDAPIVLLSLTGLSNSVHTVTVTNIAATQGGAFGFLTVDRVSLAGTVSPPSFAQGTTIATVPMAFSYHVPLTLGGHTPQLEVLLDSGAAASAWVVWVGCTQDVCQGHNLYVPSTGSSFFNFSIIDNPAFGDGSDNFTTWRVNDTVGFGSVTTTATFGAAFHLHAGGEALDGNFGLAKGFFLPAPCLTVTYPNFVEDAFSNGKIKNAVIALYQLAPNDSPAAGVTSVAQLGGIDQNKFTGSMDWIPMNLESMWQSPSQTRTVKISSTSAAITPAFGHPAITFDTGDPGLLGIPTDDWTLLVNAVGATQDSNSNWWFPCGSTMSLGLKGNQGRTYTFALGDVTNQQNGLCGALANDAGATTNWIMGAPFLDQYYLVFHYQANVMGLGTKNLAASAATTSVFIGQS